MFALRSAARLAPRMAPRAIMATRVAPAMSSALRVHGAAAFSVSARVQSEAANKLLASLGRELEYEEKVMVDEAIPETIIEFNETSGFQVIDAEGSDEVKLVKELNGEKITISFSISDLGFNNPMLEDESFEDEEANHAQKSEETEGGEEGEDLFDPTPISVQVVIEKPGENTGVLSADLTVQDGGIAVENVAYFKNGKVAMGEQVEDNWTRSKVYAGPTFETLDEEVQESVEAYLGERGVDAQLALFVQEYANWKEQKEYVGWMKNITGFLRA